MRFIVLLGLLLGAAAVPAPAKAQNAQQLLQGLTSGDRDRDQALNEAFERGYRKGRQDEARTSQNRGGVPNDSDRGYSNDRRYPNPNHSTNRDD